MNLQHFQIGQWNVGISRTCMLWLANLSLSWRQVAENGVIPDLGEKNNHCCSKYLSIRSILRSAEDLAWVVIRLSILMVVSLIGYPIEVQIISWYYFRDHSWQSLTFCCWVRVDGNALTWLVNLWWFSVGYLNFCVRWVF